MKHYKFVPFYTCFPFALVDVVTPTDLGDDRLLTIVVVFIFYTFDETNSSRTIGFYVM